MSDLTKSLCELHIEAKHVIHRMDAALARQRDAEDEHKRTGLASKKDAIETAAIARRQAYHDLLQIAQQLTEKGY